MKDSDRSRLGGHRSSCSSRRRCQAVRLCPQVRRLGIELLEDRRLLAWGPFPESLEAPKADIFGLQQVITTQADAARSVYAADLDGDGDQDVLSASTNDDKIAWYENLTGVDATPPMPEPSTWQTEPYATEPTSISMTATAASDTSGVEYYFDETSGNPGGSDSGWQDGNTYEDTGLSPGTTYTYQVKTRDKSPIQNEGTPSLLRFATTEVAPDAEVAGRHVFYNNSVWDGNDAGASEQDDAAIAPDPDEASDLLLGKTALLPGGTASFQNYTSYARGINGIMVDMAGLAGTPVAGDFEFKVGNDNDPAGWGNGPEPTSVTVRSGAGDGGSDRVTLIWDDHDPSHPETTAVAKQWLQVTVLATPITGLTEPYVFYFGNAIGESGDSTTDAKVNAIDMLAARNNPHNFFDKALIDDFVDFDRDEKVNATDMLIARNNTTNFFTALKLIAVPPAAGDAVPGGKSVESRVESLESRVEGKRLRVERSELWAGTLDWLVEFEPASGRTRGSTQHDSNVMTLDELLAIEQP